MEDNILRTISEFEEAETYWLNKLTLPLNELKLPVDFTAAKYYKAAVEEIKFGRPLSDKITTVGKNNDLALYIVLLTSFKILLYHITGQDDIMVGAPIYSDINGKYNKYIVSRNFIDPGMNFKELLTTVKETVVQGCRNEYFPFDNLIKLLEIEKEFSLFKVVLAFEGIHNKKFLNDINENFENQLTFWISRDQEELEGEIIYNANLFEKDTIEGLPAYYLSVLNQVLHHTGIKIKDIDILSPGEKDKILYEFNKREVEMGVKTLPELFERQAASRPDFIAIRSSADLVNIYDRLNPETIDLRITYDGINQRANRLARKLGEKGVRANRFVGIMVRHPIELVVGLWAILKAGGAYLPIDHTYPDVLKDYIFEDSRMQLLLVEDALKDTPTGSHPGLSTLVIDDDDLSAYSPSNLDLTAGPSDPAYVIYTSGTTGKPKGTLIPHQGIVNYTSWRIDTYNYTEKDFTLQPLSYAFDGFGSNFFSSQVSGGILFIVPEDKRTDPHYITGIIRDHGVTNISLVPGMYKYILDHAGKDDLKTLRFVVLAGDKSSRALVGLSMEKAPKAQLINEYGPTEASVTAAAHPGMDENTGSKIGKAISNTRVYILNHLEKLSPVKIPGELCIAGIGLAKGYLNNVELTREKFVSNPFIPGETLYKTGDLARWLPDGTIDFIGRSDYQVKIRGFRVEVTEITKHLEAYEAVKESVVTVNSDENGEKYLCAYITARSQWDENRLKKYLAGVLPGYMIPSYFIPIDNIPMTPNGKIDHRALPDPGVKKGEELIPPRDELEQELQKIWAEVLEVDRELIGINSNFFDLGGHSLKLAVVISKIHKRFDVKVPSTELFKTPDIMGLALYINRTAKEKYIAIEPVEKKEYYVLSSAQLRLFFLQQVDTRSTVYNAPQILPLESTLETDKLESTFNKIISRHESLRTSVKVIAGEPVQIIEEDVEFAIDYYEQGSEDGEDVGEILKNFIKPFKLSLAPHLRVGLIKTKEGNYLLLLDMHHIISDGISQEILREEFMNLYDGQVLPPLRLHYKDYAQWQQTTFKKEESGFKRQEQYWLNRFKGNVPVLNLPIDYPRQLVRSNEGDSTLFDIPGELTAKVKQISKDKEATLFIIFLAVYMVLLSKYTNKEDIVVGAPVAGRDHADLEKIIGMFVNMMAFRNFPRGNQTFREFLEDVKENALLAYENQGYPFEELIDKLNLRGDSSRNLLLDSVFQFRNLPGGQEEAGPPVEEKIGDDVVNPYEMQHNISHFDLYVSAHELSGFIRFRLEYSTALFKKSTIEKIAGHYVEILQQVAENLNIPLKEIKLSHDFVTIEPRAMAEYEADF